MAVIPQPNVPEPAMPWAREITRLVNELMATASRQGTNNIALNKQVVTATTAAGITRTVSEEALGTAEVAVEAAAVAQLRAEAPVTDEDLAFDSLTVWPFIPAAIPGGSFADGAVTSTDIADFAITAKKFNTNRHQIF